MCQDSLDIKYVFTECEKCWVIFWSSGASGEMEERERE